ncbi:MAG: RDD family protein [Planctomycetota bacterium]|jgi:uncharacterized RDD family membrane protein YckC
MSDQTPIPQTDTPGYLSERDKRTFTITTGILGAVFFIAQFILPFVVMMAVMPSFLLSFKMAEPHHGACWQNSLWYVEGAQGPRPTSESPATLNKIDLDGQKDSTVICELPTHRPWLLAGPDRLWVITSSDLAYRQQDNLVIVSQSEQLGDICRPFLHHGRPAVIQATPQGLSLMVFEDTWQKQRDLDLKTEETPTDIEANLQVLSDAGKLHFFLRHGDTLYYSLMQDDQTELAENPWQKVTQVRSRWQTLLLDGQPLVFIAQQDDFHGKIAGLHISDGRWTTFFTERAAIVGEMGAYPVPQSGRTAVLLQSFPGSLRLLLVEDNRVVSTTRYGRGFPFPRGFAVAIFIPQALTLTMPLILAVILSTLMRKHRMCRYIAGSLDMPFASLARRAAAQIVDALFLGGPAVAGYLMMFFCFVNMEEMFTSAPFFPLAGFAFMAAGLAWAFMCLFLFSILEGRWGATPGKWILGIRVFGTDLRPCGFGRALVRNLLKFVDGFFNFMVGVMIVALTENWQRVGDMAARTVVVYVRNQDMGEYAGSLSEETNT